MQLSSNAKVRQMYEESAETYAEMMDAEIDLPLYGNHLSRLAEDLTGLAGALLDTSCGSGHMLWKYRQDHEPDRPLIGIDLSPSMVAHARGKLGPTVEITVGDMTDLHMLGADSVAGVLSFFALHHLSPSQAAAALKEWHRVLAPKGRLLVATWEGSGPIDYGEAADIVALRHSLEDLRSWTQAANFVVDRSLVDPVADMGMDAVYLAAKKAAV